MKHVTILGTHIHTLQGQEIIDICKIWLTKDNGQHWIITANPEILLKARFNAWFFSILQRADIVTADGVGIQWAGSFLQYVRNKTKGKLGIIRYFFKTLAAVLLRPAAIRGPIPERISGADIIGDIATVSAKLERHVMLIGGREKTATRAANRLRELIPGLSVSGYTHDHIATPYPSYDLHLAIEQERPSILFIGYGAPRQEEWIHQNLHRYPFVRIAMGVGGALDFLAGNTTRAPVRYQAHGLEWFWRVIHQPKRLFRTLHATLYFPLLVFINATKRSR